MPLPSVVGTQESLTRILVVLPPAYEYSVPLSLKASVTYQTNSLNNLQQWPTVGLQESN
jgi:hypothetical protein